MNTLAFGNLLIEINAIGNMFYITFNQMIKTDLFVWLQEAVLEETGTMIDYVKPDNNWFPFYETTCDECVGIEELLQVSDKEKFKNKYNIEK